MPDSLQWLQDKYDIYNNQLDDKIYSANEVSEFIDEFIKENNLK
jgi:hypothetical protein